MGRSFADILHAYEEAQAELDAMAGYEQQYPDYYDQVYAEWEAARDEYEEALARGQCIADDEAEDDEPLVCEPEQTFPLSSEPEPQPGLVCGGGDTVFLDVPVPLRIKAHCEHSTDRKVGPGDTLVVVTDANGDEISVENTGDGAVSWSVSGTELSSQEGNTCKFKATATAENSFWPISIDPTIFVVYGDGDALRQDIAIHARPATQITKQWALDPDILESLRTGTDVLKNATRSYLGVEPIVEYVAGELNLSGRWVERADGAADWAFKVEGKVRLIHVAGKFPLGTDQLKNRVAAWGAAGEYAGQIADWLLNANIFLQAGGKAHLVAGYDSQQSSDSPVAELICDIYLKLGFEAGIAGGECVKVETDIGAAVVPSGGLGVHDRKGLYCQAGLKFGGLKGKATVKMGWGFWAIEEEWTLIDEFDIYPNADSPQGAGRFYLPYFSDENA